MQIRVESNLKLDLIDNDSNSMVKDKNSREVHFVLFESVIEKKTTIIKPQKFLQEKLANLFSWSTLSIWKPPIKFEKWVIVDFDNCLNGNRVVFNE